MVASGQLRHDRLWNSGAVMKTIKPTRILSYFDGIEVFCAKDAADGNYVATLVEEGDVPKYLVAGVSFNCLSDLMAGQIDLKRAFDEAADGEWFLVDARASFGEPLSLEPCLKDTLPPRYLPVDGFTIEPQIDSYHALMYAHERKNCVFSFGLDSSIHIDTLSELLAYIHLMVNYAYRRSVSDLPSRDRPRVDASRATAMRVVLPAAPGSYHMVLEAAMEPDADGSSELERGLKFIDDLFETATDENAMLTVVGTRRSRLATAYSKFMRFLDEHGTGFTYGWATPKSTDARSGQIARDLATSVSYLFDVDDSPVREIKTFTGRLDKANLRTGGWGMRTNERGYVTGKSRPGNPLLSKAVLGGEYVIECEVEEQEKVWGLSRRVHYLRDMTTLQPHLDMNLLDRPPE